MKNIPYARSDVGAPSAEKIVAWLKVDSLLAVLRGLPPEQEFSLLLDFLVEFAGGRELAEARMNEMLVEQAAISLAGWNAATQKIKDRLAKLYKEGSHGSTDK